MNIGFRSETILEDALGDIRKLYREDGFLKYFPEWDSEPASAIVAVEVFKEFEGHRENRTFYHPVIKCS